MCLALPAQVVALLPGDRAKVSLEGVLKEISLGLVEDVAEGDYVVVHVGYALSKVDAEEAERTIALMAEIVDQEQAGETTDPSKASEVTA